MARLYADAEGRLLGMRTAATAAMFPADPPGTASTLDFDEATNPEIVAGLDTDWNAHRIVGGTLERGGVPVVLTAEGEASQDAREMGDVIDAIRTYLAASGNQRTDAQRMAFERNVGRVLRHLVRRA